MKSKVIYQKIKDTLEDIEKQNQYPITDESWRLLKVNLNYLEGIDNNKYDEIQKNQFDTITGYLVTLNGQYSLQSCINLLTDFHEYIIEKHKSKLAASPST